MLYDYSEFENCLPTHHQCVTVDRETEEALHAARWPTTAFDSLADFVQFTYRFSCVIQPFIFDPKRHDLESWFHADPAADERAAEYVAQHKAIKEDAHQWMSRYYTLHSIEWLNTGRHCRIVSFVDGDWPEMVGQDTDGYFTVFVADAT